MGILDKINPFREEEGQKDDAGGQRQPDAAPQSGETKASDEQQYGDGPECSVCGQPGANKSWGGQNFHKKCLRKARKMAKGMF